MKKAAEEISPGTVMRWPKSSSAGFRMAVVPSVLTSAPKWESISSLWFLER